MLCSGALLLAWWTSLVFNKAGEFRFELHITTDCEIENQIEQTTFYYWLPVPNFVNTWVVSEVKHADDRCMYLMKCVSFIWGLAVGCSDGPQQTRLLCCRTPTVNFRMWLLFLFSHGFTADPLLWSWKESVVAYFMHCPIILRKQRKLLSGQLVSGPKFEPQPLQLGCHAMKLVT